MTGFSLMKWPWVLGFFLLLSACGPLNYTSQLCFEDPRINVIIRPKSPCSPLEAGVFVYGPLEGNPKEVKRYAGYVYRALLKERLFKALSWGGRLDLNDEALARKKKAYLVELEGLEIFAPTRTTPGRLALALRILEPQGNYTVWEVTAEADLCPSYPQDLVVSLPHSGAKDLPVADSAFFELALLMARAIKCPPAPCQRDSYTEGPKRAP